MSTSTANFGFVKAAGGEKYSRILTNNNLDAIDLALKNTRRARVASFNMIEARTSTAGAGVNWGWLGVNNGRGTMNVQNDFCVVDNTGTDGAADEKGRIRIIKEGFYDVSANFTTTGNPGALNFAFVVDKVEGGSEKYPMSRDGTYGDWEAHISTSGLYLKVGDFITGYQANGNGVLWAMGVVIVYVGEP